jgi:hypothetical protein
MLEEVGGFDDRGVAVTLDSLEVGPVLRDDLCSPTPRAHRDQISRKGAKFKTKDAKWLETFLCAPASSPSRLCVKSS